ncbi:hypothetical protein Hanom_Chr07g00624741 [Helianthus anomalus]
MAEDSRILVFKRHQRRRPSIRVSSVVSLQNESGLATLVILDLLKKIDAVVVSFRFFFWGWGGWLGFFLGF